MNKIELAIFAEFLLLSLYVLAHLLVSRYLQPAKRWLAIKRIFVPFFLLSIGVGYCVGAISTEDPPTLLVLFATVIIIFLIHVGYLTVYAVLDRSISMRVVIEMDKAGAPLTFRQIEDRYNPAAAFERRLEILVDSGFIKREGDRYVLLKKGRRTGAFIYFLKNLYRTGEGG